MRADLGLLVPLCLLAPCAAVGGAVSRRNLARYGADAVGLCALLSRGTAAGAAVDVLVGPGEEISSISAALDAAAPDATIRVRPGVYEERVLIRKPVRLVKAQEEGEVRREATSQRSRHGMTAAKRRC